MCGIVGIFGHKATKPRLHKMLETQEHRGPDHTGTHVVEGVAIGHNRLSIIDLSAAANQPFFSNDKRYVIAFNGAIYNYVELKKELQNNYHFETQSDTEVLLASYLKWGASCLEKLNGMFAFFIWDALTQELFAARDRFGVKPLYYSIAENSLLIASEIKTLFAGGVPKNTYDQVWANYFAYGSYGMPNETFWNGISQLQGGFCLTYKNGALKTRQWYDFEKQFGQQPQFETVDELKSAYNELLKKSIQLRFRSDVPIGFNVSGGLDSSLLLALVNTLEKGQNINAYSFYTNNKNYDELPWVEALIGLTKNPLNKVLLTPDAIIQQSEKMADLQDEPFGGVPTLAYAGIFQKAKTHGVKVLLDGQGMDEQWAGYDYYTKTSHNVIQGMKTSPFRTNVLHKDFLKLAQPPEYPTPFDDKVLNLQYRDLLYTKIPRALRFNDRVSMVASTELREPFLDYKLVEFAFSQPLTYKINNGVQKYVLRLLAGDYLPNSIRHAPKRPLQTPQREWLANDLKTWVMDQLQDLEHSNWFDTQELEKELQTYFGGEQQSSFHIWQWINTKLLLH